MIWSIGSFISKLSGNESQTAHNEILWEILFNEEKSHCTEVKQNNTSTYVISFSHSFISIFFFRFY